MYETGRGVKRSDAKAAEWYRKAAQQGMPKAQCNLGVMHDRGRGSVVAQNDALAARYYRAAAEQGLADAQVSSWVGCCAYF
jgi:TPR repeat protein